MPDVTPQTSVPATSTPSTGFTPSAPSTDSIFADLEKQMGLDDDSQEQMNLAEAKKYKDGSEEDILNLDDVETTEEDQTEEVDTSEGTKTEETQTEEATEFPSLEFKGKVGDKDYAFKVKDQAHFEKIVKRAIIAEDLYSGSRPSRKRGLRRLKRLTAALSRGGMKGGRRNFLLVSLSVFLTWPMTSSTMHAEKPKRDKIVVRLLR